MRQIFQNINVWYCNKTKLQTFIFGSWFTFQYLPAESLALAYLSEVKSPLRTFINLALIFFEVDIKSNQCCLKDVISSYFRGYWRQTVLKKLEGQWPWDLKNTTFLEKLSIVPSNFLCSAPTLTLQNLCAFVVYLFISYLNSVLAYMYMYVYMYHRCNAVDWLFDLYIYSNML